jgi:hypothetical protein
MKKLDEHAGEVLVFKRRLLEGIPCEKWGRNGKKKPKILTVVGPDYRLITWEGRDRASSLSLNDVEKAVGGCETDTLVAAKAGGGAQPQCCLSLVGGDYTLDVELASESDAGSVLVGFQLLLLEISLGKDRYVDDRGIVRQRKEILFTLASDELRLLTESVRFVDEGDVEAITASELEQQWREEAEAEESESGRAGLGAGYASDGDSGGGGGGGGGGKPAGKGRGGGSSGSESGGESSRMDEFKRGGNDSDDDGDGGARKPVGRATAARQVGDGDDGESDSESDY